MLAALCGLPLYCVSGYILHHTAAKIKRFIKLRHGVPAAPHLPASTPPLRWRSQRPPLIHGTACQQTEEYRGKRPRWRVFGRCWRLGLPYPRWLDSQNTEARPSVRGRSSERSRERMNERWLLPKSHREGYGVRGDAGAGACALLSIPGKIRRRRADSDRGAYAPLSLSLEGARRAPIYGNFHMFGQEAQGSGKKPNRSPAERVLFGMEEQGSGRMSPQGGCRIRKAAKPSTAAQTSFSAEGGKRRRSKADFAPTWYEWSYSIYTYEFEQNKIEAQRSWFNFERRSSGASAL